MKAFIAGGYFGFALYKFAGLRIMDWEFYAILIPTTVLISWAAISWDY